MPGRLRRDLPTISTTNLSLDYTEDDGPVAIDPNLTLSDLDDTEFDGATVVVSGGSTAEDRRVADPLERAPHRFTEDLPTFFSEGRFDELAVAGDAHAAEGAVARGEGFDLLADVDAIA